MSEEDNNRTNAWNVPDSRPDLAFPQADGGDGRALRPYGKEETFPADVPVLLTANGKLICLSCWTGKSLCLLLAADGETKIIAHHQRFDFSGELNLLNSQGSLVDARTVGESRLLRIPRNELQRLMRAEGDIANLIMQATIWRRIGILSELAGGVVVTGHAGDAETTELQRFLLRNTLSAQDRRGTPRNKLLCSTTPVGFSIVAASSDTLRWPHLASPDHHGARR